VQISRLLAGEAVPCLASGYLLGRLICSAFEIVGRHLKARGLCCIAAFACPQCSPAKAGRLGSKLVSI
jgi:hypothetical protein